MAKSKSAWDNEESHENKKLLTPDQSSLTVKIIEDDTNLLHVTLGMTKEDAKRIQKIIYDAIESDRAAGRDKTNSSALMVKLSNNCVHANQLAFACFALGMITSKTTHQSISNTDNMPDFLKDIFKDFLKGNNGPFDNKE